MFKKTGYIVLVLALVASVLQCKQGDDNDDMMLLGALALLGQNAGTTDGLLDGGTVSLSADTPVAQEVTLVAGDTFEYTVTLDDVSASVLSRASNSSGASVTIQLIRSSDEETLATAISYPGDTSVKLVYHIPNENSGIAAIVIIKSDKAINASVALKGVESAPTAPDNATSVIPGNYNFLAFCYTGPTPTAIGVQCGFMDVAGTNGTFANNMDSVSFTLNGANQKTMTYNAAPSGGPFAINSMPAYEGSIIRQ